MQYGKTDTGLNFHNFDTTITIIIEILTQLVNTNVCVTTENNNQKTGESSIT